MSIQKIEVCRLYRTESEGPIKAFCDVQFDDDYIVKGFKIVEGKDGLFVGMPSELGKHGRWYSTFMPLDDSVKSKLEDAIIEAYES